MTAALVTDTRAADATVILQLFGDTGCGQPPVVEYQFRRDICHPLDDSAGTHVHFQSAANRLVAFAGTGSCTGATASQNLSTLTGCTKTVGAGPVAYYSKLTHGAQTLPGEPPPPTIRGDTFRSMYTAQHYGGDSSCNDETGFQWSVSVAVGVCGASPFANAVNASRILACTSTGSTASTWTQNDCGGDGGGGGGGATTTWQTSFTESLTACSLFSTEAGSTGYAHIDCRNIDGEDASSGGGDDRAATYTTMAIVICITWGLAGFFVFMIKMKLRRRDATTADGSVHSDGVDMTDVPKNDTPV
jgi:hypothetical protein